MYLCLLTGGRNIQGLQTELSKVIPYTCCYTSNITSRWLIKHLNRVLHYLPKYVLSSEIKRNQMCLKVVIMATL